MHPRTSGQDVRVDMRGSNGTRGTVTVTTGPRGTFEARFVIDELEWTKDRRDPRDVSGTRCKLTSPMPSSWLQRRRMWCGSDSSNICESGFLTCKEKADHG